MQFYDWGTFSPSVDVRLFVSIDNDFIPHHDTWYFEKINENLITIFSAKKSDCYVKHAANGWPSIIIDRLKDCN